MGRSPARLTLKDNPNIFVLAFELAYNLLPPDRNQQAMLLFYSLRELHK